MNTVHIKIADEGWILERCAQEIVNFNHHITFSTGAMKSAEIQYYLNYSSYNERVSDIEVGFFTHIEEDPNAKKRFFYVAERMNHCVCMSEKYANELRNHGINNVSVIRPGVNLEDFTPRIRIGVVGRTYPTGRKGEEIVEKVIDLDGIDWYFTGTGWPGPSTKIAPDKMAQFYNSIDYVLVPALYEGGPMSVIEGLACGKEIISSDVGWSNEFPHIPFENGNAASLRAVLERLVSKREGLRSSVLNCTWKSWATQHIELFSKLLEGSNKDRNKRISSIHSNSMVGSRRVVVLATHGGEEKSQGGPSIRVPRTVENLKKIGVNAFEHGRNFHRPDLIHIFNIWPTSSSSQILNEAKKSKINSVLSPIFLNLTSHNLYANKVPNFYKNLQGGDLENALLEVHTQSLNKSNLPIHEPYSGYHDEVRKIILQADHLILLSQYEKRCLDFLGVFDASKATIIHNPVNADIFDNADPEIFKSTYQLEKYVIQVGRIEPRKNQLLVAEACRRLDVPVVFVGHEGNAEYATILRQIAGPNALFIPRLAQDDPMFASAVIGASAFFLPSWSEGAPLAALEAGAAGVPLILSNMSGEKEYFEDHALYVHPADLLGAVEALNMTLMSSHNLGKRKKQSDHIRTTYAWDRHSRETLEVYNRVQAKHDERLASKRQSSEGRIFFDVTDWAHGGDRLTGVSRVQLYQYRSLPQSLKLRVTPVTWRHGTNRFFLLSHDELISDDITQQIVNCKPNPAKELSEKCLLPEDRFYSTSIAWSGNKGHHDAIIDLKARLKVPVALMIHDIVRLELAHLYDDKRVSDFRDRLVSFASTVDCLTTYSKATEASLSSFLKSYNFFNLSHASVTLGDGKMREGVIETTEQFKNELSKKPFMITVGTIEPRKNHIVLLQAMKKLISEFGVKTPLLVIAGSDYVATRQLNYWLDQNPDVAQFVVRLVKISDNELGWLYANALMNLYPSVLEGWGLPIAEGFEYGTVCLCSNVSSMPEASRGFALLLDPYDPSAWSDAIADRIRNPIKLASERLHIRTNWKPRDWETSVKNALEAVQSFPVRPISELQPEPNFLSFPVRPISEPQLELNFLWRRLFRSSNGRPTRALRRVLFHTSGKPRRVFFNLIFQQSGNPRPAFQQWINSQEYLMLPWPAKHIKHRR